MIITLIPKVNSPQKTGQYRSISLCNTVYKIISKILVDHMHFVLQKDFNPV